jgi:hypothetical protein
MDQNLKGKSIETDTCNLKKIGQQSKPYVHAGLQQILNRIPHIRGLHLDQAVEYCKHQFAAVVTYPLNGQTKKKSRDETDE